MINKILPPTTKRVACHTCFRENNIIRDQTVECLDLYKDTSAEVIADRIKRLNYEWDTERYIEANAALITILSAVLGLRRKCFFVLAGMAGIFLLQHALLGFCPPDSVIRKIGIRTAEEINNERTVLKMLRGDFSQEFSNVSEMLSIAEK